MKTSFQEKITTNEDGRYVIRVYKQEHRTGQTHVYRPWYVINFPWTCEILQDNRAVAVKRLKRATQKLECQNQFQVDHKKFRDWLEKGIIDRPRNPTHKGHFLPHKLFFNLRA